MRNYTLVVLLTLFACLAPAQSFTNGQAARAVLGQEDFTFGETLPSGTAQNLLGGPSGLAYANGLLFVADSNKIGAGVNNNRVVIYDTTQIPGPHADLTQLSNPDPYCGLCGYAASNVLGEPDFVSQGPQAVSSQSLQTPTAVATDGHMLAVADTDNNRVLIWNSIPSSIDQPANIVLGSANFTTPGVVATTQTSVTGPQGVWIQNGKLFVADTHNNRVLIWNSIPTQNNQPADLVLGQSSFGTGSQSCPPSLGNPTVAANQLCSPASVSSDGTHLFVSDLGYSRVLIWNSIPTSNDQPADVVVGQPDMTSAVANNPAVCPNGAGPQGACAGDLNFPKFALSDGRRLFIADGNDRVLIFNSIPTSNGASADAVLGQPDFTSNVVSSTNANPSLASTAIDNTGSVDTIPAPQSLAWDGTNLYVSDATDLRVLVFTPAETPLPDNSIVNWASQITRQEGVVTLSLPATTGAIVAKDTVTVSLGLASTASPVAYTYTIKANDTLDTIAQGLVNVINANGGDPNATAIFAGAGTGSLYLSSKQVNLGYDTITLSATNSSGGIDIVATASGGYLSAGTAATGAPGMLVLINGTNLADVPAGSPVTASTSSTLPTNLGGAEVYMDGLAAPLLSVSTTQIVAQIPYTFTNNSGSSANISNVNPTDRNSTSVYVRTLHSDGSITSTNATPVYIAPANPGLFSTAPGQPLPPASGALHSSTNPSAVVSIDGTAHAGDTATITINGRNYTYTVATGDSLTSIVNGLIAKINGVDPQVTASAGAAFTRVVLTAIQPGAAGNGIPIAGSTSANAQVTVTAYNTQTCCDVVPGSAITPANPAAPGEMITLDADGLGLLANSVVATAGQPFNGPTPNSAANEVVVTMGGSTGQVIGAGLPTGAIGHYQIQVIVPTTLGAGNAQVYTAQNAFISNIVTLPIGTPATSISTTQPPPPPSPLHGNIDVPNGGTYTGTAAFGGWVLDDNATISAVRIYVDGVYYGAAAYGASRADACAVFPSSPNCTPNPNVGWNIAVDTTRFADGAHRLQMTATGSDGVHLTLAGSFTTANASPGNPTRIFADQPGLNSGPLQGVVSFSGWAVNSNAAISTVTLSVDGAPLGPVTTTSRPDVCAVYPSQGCPNIGWSILVDTNKFSNGTHSLQIAATATNGQFNVVATPFTVSNGSAANPMIVDIDSPGLTSGTFSGTVTFGGWVVDSDAPISSVQISIDGVSFGDAPYGGSRPDVCTGLGNFPGCPNVGWTIPIDTTVLGDGQHTLSVTGTSTGGQSSTVSTTFTVANLTASNPLKVTIDAPGPNSAPFSGTAAFSGWALSGTASISGVQVLVDGVLRGSASRTGSRTDVCAVYPSPDCPDVGWNYAFDTTLLSNGTHTIEVTATSSTGQRGTASVSFTVANSNSNGPARIYIDQPNGQSDPFVGLAQFFGWAIDDNNLVNTVAVSIDGAPQPNAAYGSSRPDVCAAYPNRPGCPAVGWTFLLDTTKLADGAHTLAITVYAGADHISASTQFQVANWSSTTSLSIDIDAPSPTVDFYSGTVNFSGWVLDRYGPVSSVSVAIDGVPLPGASYGAARTDVCAAFPGFAGCPNVGWNFPFDTTLLANGDHTLAVTATSAAGQSSTVSRTFTVDN